MFIIVMRLGKLDHYISLPNDYHWETKHFNFIFEFYLAIKRVPIFLIIHTVA